MSFPSLFTYCPHCASTLIEFQVDGSDRRKCPDCNWVQYRNPTVGVAVVILEGSQLLVGVRKDGGWCIPCGHVEWNERIEDAAVREIGEETGLEIALGDVIAVKSNFHHSEQQTVGVWFRGQRIFGTPEPGSDLIRVEFIELNQLPEMIFPTDREVIQLLNKDC